ncbi:hypothetical protein H2198_000758 [Neophaeococcomyces mojaviensis]|uniref:Uncharacterized protein n=1 Tax=Neophaeococcomyces mojaviensis TaxID=3383035 RepID=A0ACC3AJD0_9EURO|nr:hypothetical protein H2198_000758 [Knufia sp. JES_112]
MLEAFEIFSTSGVVLWSRNNSPNVAATAVNTLINDVFIEEKTRATSFQYDKYTLRWTLVKDLGLIFVAVYQSLLHLSWVDQFLEEVQTVFVRRYREQLEARATVSQYDFDAYYDELLRRQDQATDGEASRNPPRAGVEDKKASPEARDDGGPPPPQPPQLLRAQSQTAPLNGESVDSTPVQSPESSRPTTPLPGIGSHLLSDKRPGSRGSRRARKAANVYTTASANASSGDEARRPKTPRSNAKKGRVWDADGMAAEEDGAVLDYSNVEDGSLTTNGNEATPDFVAPETWGTKNKQGQFVLKDLDDELNDILKESGLKKAESEASTTSSGALGVISGYFRNIVGGKTLTKQDLEKPLKAMEEHLIKKNVAREAALRLCEGVEAEMIGKKTGAFESTDKALQPALENSLRKLLTPKTSLDLLQEIESVTKPTKAGQPGRPYVISVVGVNGVGKSTNLSKICYFLLQNDYRVLVVAGDTFRSGAVEQLAVHVRNLKELSSRENVGQVDLYQKGYGKDAANVARDAVGFAAANDFNVVLIDTAGRAHNNAQLMSALEKFGDFAKPDKILQVAEALVGNDSVNQARNFNKAFGRNRGLDGFIISKCDTVGDQIGTIVSMVAATGIPVVFLGVGQHYGDLRQLSIPWALRLLMN